MQTIAIPTLDDNLSAHFGLAEKFHIYHVKDGKIVDLQILTPPPHQPGIFPQWLKDINVTEVLAEGIGQKAIDNFKLFGIVVYSGIEKRPPDEILHLFLNDKLEKHENFCDH